MAYTLAQLQPEYAAEWLAMTPDAADVAEINAIAQRLNNAMPSYREVAKATGVPPAIIAVIHNRESDQDFKTNLANGDPLTARTTHVPAGRPPLPAVPPFTWVDAAIDALTYEGLDKVTSWTVEQAAFSLETYNGFGYREYHDERSPYLWAATNEQQAGKYVADGQFNRTAMDSQIGCMPVLAALAKIDLTLALPMTGAAPAPAPTPTPEPAPVPAPPVVVVLPPAPTPTSTRAFVTIIAALLGAVAALSHPVVVWIQRHFFGG